MRWQLNALLPEEQRCQVGEVGIRLIANGKHQFLMRFPDDRLPEPEYAVLKNSA